MNLPSRSDSLQENVAGGGPPLRRRYIDAVVRFVPRNRREVVRREMNNRIESLRVQLPRLADDEPELLQQMGNPGSLAELFRTPLVPLKINSSPCFQWFIRRLLVAAVVVQIALTVFSIPPSGHSPFRLGLHVLHAVGAAALAVWGCGIVLGWLWTKTLKTSVRTRCVPWTIRQLPVQGVDWPEARRGPVVAELVLEGIALVLLACLREPTPGLANLLPAFSANMTVLLAATQTLVFAELVLSFTDLLYPYRTGTRLLFRSALEALLALALIAIAVLAAMQHSPRTFDIPAIVGIATVVILVAVLAAVLLKDAYGHFSGGMNLRDQCAS